MHQHLFVSLSVVGMSFLSAQVLAATDSSKTAEVATDTATPFSFTGHTRHTSTASRTSDPSPRVSTGQHYDEEENRCRDCVSDVCQPPPSASGEQIDWSIPCWAATAIQKQCIFGPEALDWLKDVYENPHPDRYRTNQWKQQPPDLYRACLCSSRFAEMSLGCGRCYKEHGLHPSEIWSLGFTSDADSQDEVMRHYCDAENTPTEDSLSEAFYSAIDWDPVAASKSSRSFPAASSTSYSFSFYDPIGNATDVSLYFTPTVPGSSAYVVAMPTASPNPNDEKHTNPWYTHTSLPTSDGQIVPTIDGVTQAAGGDDRDGGKSDNEDSESTGGTMTKAGGAIQTASACSGFVVGVIGLAVLAIAL